MGAFSVGETTNERKTMQLFILMCTLVHMLPPDVLDTLGAISDHISDLSPEFLRGIEHVLFSLLLN